MSQANWWEAAPVEGAADDWWSTAPLEEAKAAQALADQSRPAVPNAPVETTWGEFAGGQALNVAQGVMRAPKALTDLASELGIPGAQSGSDFFNRGIESAEYFKPDAFKQEAQQGFVEYDAEGNMAGLQLPSAEAGLGDLLSSIPQIPQFLVGGGMLRAGASKLPLVGPKLATALGYGSANAALVAPGQAQDTRAEALELGMPQEQADDAALKALLGTGALTAITGGAGGLLSGLSGSTASSLPTALLRGYLAEAPFEGGEEFGQSIIGDLALGLDPNFAQATDVGLRGAAAGGLPGSAIAGLEYVTARGAPPAQPQAPVDNLALPPDSPMPEAPAIFDPELDALLKSELGIDPNQAPAALAPKPQTTASPAVQPMDGQPAPAPSMGDFLQLAQQYVGQAMQQRTQPQAQVTTDISTDIPAPTEVTNARLAAPPALDAGRDRGPGIAGPDRNGQPVLGSPEARPDAANPVAGQVDPAVAAGRVDFAPLRAELGWAGQGGRMLRSRAEWQQEGELAPEGDVVGRTSWTPQMGLDGAPSGLWSNRPDKALTVAQANVAFDKYDAGEKLRPIEQRFIDHAMKVNEGYESQREEGRREGAFIEERLRRNEAEARGETYVPWEDAPAQEFEDVPFQRGSASGDLFAPPTTRERVDAERAGRDAERNGLGRDEVPPSRGAGDLFAGPRPEQTDLTRQERPNDKRRSGVPRGLKAEQTADTQALERAVNRHRESEGDTGEPSSFRAVQPSALPDALRRAIAALERATDTRIVIVRNLTPEAFDFNGVNFGDGILYVNENADMPATLTASHEFVHQLKRDAPELYAQLEAEVRRQGKLTEWAEKLAKEGETRPNKVAEELTADAVADALTDPEFLQRMAERNVGLFRTVARRFLEFIDTLLGRVDRGTSAYLKDVAAFRETLLNVLEQYDGQMRGRGESDPAFQRKTAADSIESMDDSDYRGGHKAPMRDSGAPGHDLTGGGEVYPDDVYGPNGSRYYGDGSSRDQEAFSIAFGLKGRPRRAVTIYRAVPYTPTKADELAILEKQMAAYMARRLLPPGVKADREVNWYDEAYARMDELRASAPDPKQAKIGINRGDWVAITRSYAKEHGESVHGPGRYKIVSKTVMASEIFTNGDSIQEWGYDPAPSASSESGEPSFQRRESDQTKTPEFKRWFGDSKVVDENGEPLVVYHGTNRNFTEFKIGSAPGWGSGIYFTDNRTQAADEYGGGGGRVIEAYVRIENPWRGNGLPPGLEGTKAWQAISGRWDYVEDAWQEDSGFVSDALRELGYDGVIAESSNDVQGLEIVAFAPDQVKQENPDIRFQRKESPAGDGSRGAGGAASTTVDLRNADRAPLDNEPLIQREVRKVKEAVQSVRDAMAGKVKNPQTLRRRINDLRSAIFDSIVSRARALERRNPQSKALKELFNTFTAATGDSRVVGETVNDAIAARFAIFTNRARNILGNNGLERMTAAQNAQLRDAMLFPNKAMPANVRKAATALRKLLDTQREDLIAAGVDVGEVGDVGYLPRIYNDAAILDDEAGFLKAAQQQYAKHEFPRLVGPTARGILYNDRAALARFLAEARRAARSNPKVAKALAEIKDKIKAYRGNSDLQLVREIEASIDGIYADVAQSYGEANASAWLHRIKTPNVRDVFSGVAPSGAPLTKERTLSGAADTVMADYLTTDMYDLLDSYAKTSARKIEHAKTYGPKGERIQDLIDRASREGVPKEDLEQAASMVQTVTGQDTGKGLGALKPAADWLHAWSYIALLAKAPISSLVEATTIALRTGDLQHTVAPLIQFFRAIGLGDTKKRNALNELALTIGVNGHKAVEEMLMNRLGGDHAMTVRPARLLAAFFRATWLTQLTRAQRAYAVGAATGFLRKQAQRAAKGDREAAALLNEVGIADHAAFNGWMQAQGALPDSRTLFDANGRPTPMGQDYMVAVRRIVDQSIQNPGKEHRPEWTNTETGRLFTGIMSFNYASYENIIRREKNLAERHLKEGGAAEVGKRLTMAIPAAGALVLAQTITSTLREILFNADRLEDKDNEELAKEMAMLGLSRTFGLGSASPIIQWWTGLKYQRSMAETMIGAGPGLLAANFDTLAEVFTDRNSESTDTAEFRAGQSIYRSIVAPILNVVLSRVPGGGAAIMALSDKEMANGFGELFGDKPEPRTELDKKYQEAVRELEDVQSVVKDRMALLPRSQWKEELDALKEEYPGILAGVTLDTYKMSKENMRKGQAGLPKQDQEGRPTLKFGKGEEGSVLGELEGYPYWYNAGGRPKQKEGEGIQDRISTLNKAIKNVRETDTMTVKQLATFGDQAPGENSPPSVQAILDAIDAGTLKPGKTASDKQRKAVMEELMELRRAEKRAALAVIEKGKRGEPIKKTDPRR